jgi:hypothetical protein
MFDLSEVLAGLVFAMDTVEGMTEADLDSFPSEFIGHLESAQYNLSRAYDSLGM